MNPVAKLSLLLPAFAAACAVAPPPSPPPEPPAPPPPDQVWEGALHCSPKPGAAIAADEPITITVTGDDVQYRHPLRGGAGGVVERGAGRVERNGAVALDGGAETPGQSFTASYQGTLPAAGREAHLRGTQQWRSDGGEDFSRSCTMYVLITPMGA